MLVAAFVLSLLLGRLAGGRLHHLAGLPLRHLALFFIAFGLQVLLEFAPLAGIEPAAWTGVVHILSYIILAVALTVNARVPGVPVLLMGVVLNGLVVALNGGRMPVGPEIAVGDRPAMLAQDLRHTLLTDDTRLAALADVHAVHIFAEGPTGYSVGDLFLIAGLVWLVVRGMQGAVSDCEDDPAVVK